MTGSELFKTVAYTSLISILCAFTGFGATHLALGLDLSSSVSYWVGMFVSAFTISIFQWLTSRAAIYILEAARVERDRE